MQEKNTNCCTVLRNRILELTYQKQDVYIQYVHILTYCKKYLPFSPLKYIVNNILLSPLKYVWIISK